MRYSKGVLTYLMRCPVVVKCPIVRYPEVINKCPVVRCPEVFNEVYVSCCEVS